MSRTTVIALIIAALGWSAVAVFEWLPRYPRATVIVHMPADGSAPKLPAAIDVK